MKEKTKLLTVAYLLFLLLFALSGYLEGTLSSVAYYSAFIIPSVLALYIGRDAEGADKLCLSLDREGVKLLFVSAAPTVGIVWALSYLTALMIYFTTGATDSTDVGNSFFGAIITYAAVPALAEELLFRYLPMRIVAPYSKSRAVWLSAVFFAVAHMSPFSLIYAFAAGFIFMTLDLATESIWPSVILHFVNNVISLVLIFYPSSEVKIWIIVILCLLFAASMPLLIGKRKDMLNKLLDVFVGECKTPVDPVVLLFIIPAVVVGASLLF